MTRRNAAQRVSAAWKASPWWQAHQARWIAACARARAERNGTARVLRRAPLATPAPKKLGHQPRGGPLKPRRAPESP